MSGPDLWTIAWVAVGLVFAYGWRIGGASEQRTHHALWVLPVLVAALWTRLGSALQEDPVQTWMAILIVAGLVIGNPNRRLGATTCTQLQVNHLRERNARLETAPCHDAWTRAVALFGIRALAGTPLQPYVRLRTDHRAYRYGPSTACMDGDNPGSCSA